MGIIANVADANTRRSTKTSSMLVLLSSASAVTRGAYTREAAAAARENQTFRGTRYCYPGGWGGLNDFCTICARPNANTHNRCCSRCCCTAYIIYYYYLLRHANRPRLCSTAMPVALLTFAGGTRAHKSHAYTVHVIHNIIIVIIIMYAAGTTRVTSAASRPGAAAVYAIRKITEIRGGGTVITYHRSRHVHRNSSGLRNPL